MGLAMSTDTLISIALGVLLVCWAVGAHNRLMRLKHAVGREYAQIDAQLRQREEFIAQLLRTGEHLDSRLLGPLEEAAAAVHQATDQVRLRPTDGTEALTLQQAERHLDEALAGVWNSPETRKAAWIDPGLRQAAPDLQHLDNRLELASAPYNQAVAAFNEAAKEFPAWLIARLVRLKPLPGLALGRHGAAREAARPLMIGRREGDTPTAPPGA